MKSQILKVWELGYFTDREIAEALKVSHYDIRKATANLSSSDHVSLELMQEIRTMYDNAELDLEDVDRLAEELNCKPSIVKSCMVGKVKLDKKQAIIDELAKKTPQKVIAEMFGVSQAAVSKLNPNPISKPRGKKLTDEQWVELLSQYPRFTVSELARMYKTSRASIYSRINKDGH